MYNFLLHITSATSPQSSHSLELAGSLSYVFGFSSALSQKLLRLLIKTLLGLPVLQSASRASQPASIQQLLGREKGASLVKPQPA